ncbi:MAG: zf-HC2 domain-containing protein [Chloroflexota bacterium]|nr:zf-HC2 domain-containing protein [Chloroflexota bacterium]
MIDCREAVRRMWEYIDHALEPAPTEELESHLETCQRCCGELEFSRHLKEIVAASGSDQLSDPLRKKIDLLLAGGGLAAREGEDA